MTAMKDFSPREIVSELDRFIIGQTEAKRAVAVALRNRWRRRALDPALADEVQPKNILMIGPTGVGKTEISRRLAKLAGAPFIKVEATKFTEVGYVGRDVDSIVRDLVEVAIGLVRDQKRAEVQAAAHAAAEERVIDVLASADSRPATRDLFRRKLRSGELDDEMIDVEVSEPVSGPPMMEMPGQPGAMGVGDLQDMFAKAFGRPAKKKRLSVAESHRILVTEEADKLLDADQVTREALTAVEESGIVFLDEIDKVCAKGENRSAEVSREGVQRDLLPLIEGATIATKHGPVKTDHILFIASGAFHVAKPADLLPELQGRLPIRVELAALTEADFIRILTEPEHNLTRQAAALLGVEEVTVTFEPSGVAAIAAAAAEMNEAIENIGARRLHTVLERVLSELSFTAPDLPAEQRAVVIDAAYVEERLADLKKRQDLKRFIL